MVGFVMMGDWFVTKIWGCYVLFSTEQKERRRRKRKEKGKNGGEGEEGCLSGNYNLNIIDKFIYEC